MVEYTRKILNSCCDLDILKSHIDKLANEIIRAVVNKRIEHNYRVYNTNNITKNHKRIIYVVKPIIQWHLHNSNIYGNDESMQNTLYEEVIRQTINELKKTFVDSKIYEETKQTNDIYDNITNHNLIVVDWNEE